MCRTHREGREGLLCKAFAGGRAKSLTVSYRIQQDTGPVPAIVTPLKVPEVMRSICRRGSCGTGDRVYPGKLSPGGNAEPHFHHTRSSGCPLPPTCPARCPSMSLESHGILDTRHIWLYGGKGILCAAFCREGPREAVERCVEGLPSPGVQDCPARQVPPELLSPGWPSQKHSGLPHAAAPRKPRQ